MAEFHLVTASWPFAGRIIFLVQAVRSVAAWEWRMPHSCTCRSTMVGSDTDQKERIFAYAYYLRQKWRQLRDIFVDLWSISCSSSSSESDSA
ncbi:hypothetical protein BDR04DRAFT_1106295 [Suillus decipiens]|nr:hypothetical protein BDR04DRAFT_1106295 [Suillus decipiens]